MNVTLNLAAVSLLALAVSSQAFAQGGTSQPPPPPAPAAQPTVPAPHKATEQSLGDLAPYAVAIGVVVAVAVASGGSGHKYGGTGTTGTTGTTP